MSLDSENPPISIDEAIQYGRDEVIQKFEEMARAEEKRGDGRALRVIERLAAACGYRRTK